MSDDNTHQISVSWVDGRRRISRTGEEQGKTAALSALRAGKAPHEAADICLKTMYRGKPILFGGVKVSIDGTAFP